MVNEDKEQLIKELRHRIFLLETSEAKLKAAEKELQLVNKQLLDIIEFLPDATFVVDKDKTVIAWNRAIEEMTGVPKEDIIGKGNYAYALPFYGKPMPFLVDHFGVDEIETDVKYIHIERNGDMLYAEVDVPPPFKGQGAILWVTASPLNDSCGNIVGAIESIRDITYRKQLEDEIRRHRDYLEEMVKERTTELEKANKRLQQEVAERKQIEEALKKQQQKLQEQLCFTKALNRIAETISRNDDTQKVLDETAAIIGETLSVDRSSIYDIDFNERLVKGLSEWLNPKLPDIMPTKDTYSLDLFIDALSYMLKHKQWVQSHVDELDPNVVNDGSGMLLHKHMNIKSGLWYPFYFRNQAYYCLVFNQVSYRRRWRREELKFIGDAAKHVEVAIKKINIQTKLERTIDALRESEEKYREIFENANDIIYTQGLDGYYVSVNPAATKIYGYSIEEFLELNVTDIVDHNYLSIAQANIQKELMGFNSSEPYELLTYAKDGSPIWIEVSSRLIKQNDGSISGIQGTARDITDRKQAEEALKQSEIKYRTIFENTGTAIITGGEDTIITLVNTEFEKLSSYLRDEIEGKMSWTGFVSKNDLEKMKKYHHMRRTGLMKAPSKYEFQFIDKWGNIKDLLITVAMIPRTNDCLASLLDITEIKQFQKEMARFEQLNLVGEMAAGIGHEIRNPMTTVRGFLQILKGKEKSNKNIEYYDLMIEELDRANSIITQFLSLARNKPVDKAKQNLNTIVKTLQPLFQADAYKEDKHVDLELYDIPDLLLDEKEIRQLLLNFVRNGLEAMSPGGKLKIKTYADCDEIVLAVQDQGSGIRPDIIDKLGTPFFTTKDNGTGLGLAVCYSIVDRHNAKIEVETSPLGTSFIVRFIVPKG